MGGYKTKSRVAVRVRAVLTMSLTMSEKLKHNGSTSTAVWENSYYTSLYWGDRQGATPVVVANEAIRHVAKWLVLFITAVLGGIPCLLY